jgi:hypothetical protein
MPDYERGYRSKDLIDERRQGGSRRGASAGDPDRKPRRGSEDGVRVSSARVERKPMSAQKPKPTLPRERKVKRLREGRPY